MIKLRWKCHRYLGRLGGKRGILRFDDKEFCNTWVETEVSDDDWDMEMAVAFCPKCGSEMTQKYNWPEVVR